MTFIQRTLIIFPLLLLNSCGAIIKGALESAFESSSDRKIRKDTKNLKDGKPLQYYKSEKRLRVDREDRAIRDLMKSSKR